MSTSMTGLVGANGPQSAGTTDAKAVAPSTTAVLPDLGDSRAPLR